MSMSEALEEFILNYKNITKDFYNTSDLDNRLIYVTQDFLKHRSPLTEGRILVQIVRPPDTLNPQLLIKEKPEFGNVVFANSGSIYYQ